MKSHQFHLITQKISFNQWWDSTNTILPLYRNNRFGKPVSVFNIQYLGALNDLQHLLEIKGWKRYHYTLMDSIKGFLINNNEISRFPIMPKLYMNKPPQLIMLLDKKNYILVLRIWRSTFKIQSSNSTIWIGSVHFRFIAKKAL